MAYFNGRQIIFSPQVNIEGDTLPDYLIQNGNTISGLFFNDAYNLDDYLETLPYDETITVMGGVQLGNCTTVGMGLYAYNDQIDGIYVLFSQPWTIIYSTGTAIELLDIPTKGWQLNNITLSPSIMVDISAVESGFVAIKDNVVAKQEIGFGTSENETYGELLVEEWGSNS